MTVQSVLGPIDDHDLGRVDAHEHIFLRSPHLPGDEFQDLDKMVEEINSVRSSGFETVVDLTPIGLGRQPSKTAELSRLTGIHVVLATGIHRAAHYLPGHWLYTIDEAELTRLLIEDITRGIDDRDWQGPVPQPTQVRAGIIKLGASYHNIQPAEQMWFRAGAAAARETGVPMAVHTEVGTAAHQVLDELEKGGVMPSRVMLAHLDRNRDPVLHAELAGRGAFLGYDTVGRTKYHADSAILDLIDAVAELGHADKILLGTDVGRRSTLNAYGGGPGMDVLGTTFVPRLRARFGEELVASIFTANPRAYLPREVL